MTQLLNLQAYDEEDLLLISSHLQNAETRRAMMHYDKANKRFAMILLRMDNMGHTQSSAAQESKELYKTLFIVNHVFNVQHKQLSAYESRDIYELLTIYVDTTNASLTDVTQHLVLLFSHDYLLRLELECIDVILQDLMPIQ